MPTTVNFGWVYNLPNTARDTWGGDLNDTLIAIDAQSKIFQDNIALKVNAASPTFTGTLTAESATYSGTVTASGFTGPLTGLASSATQLATGRTFQLGGVVTSTLRTFDGTANITLTTSIADGALSIAKTDGLQAALDGKQATLNANQILPVTYGTAAPSGTPADGDVYLQHEA